MKAMGRPQKWTKMWRSGRKSVGARYVFGTHLSLHFEEVKSRLFPLKNGKNKSLSNSTHPTFHLMLVSFGCGQMWAAIILQVISLEKLPPLKAFPSTHKKQRCLSCHLRGAGVGVGKVKTKWQKQYENWEDNEVWRFLGLTSYNKPTALFLLSPFSICLSSRNCSTGREENCGTGTPS